MPDTTSEAQVSPEGRAHAASSPMIGSRQCPVYGEGRLHGRQTIRSASCRRERTRPAGDRRPRAPDSGDLDSPKKMALGKTAGAVS